MKKEQKKDFMDKVQDADFIETLRLRDRNCINVLAGCDWNLKPKLARKLALMASIQVGKTILLVNHLDEDEDRDFMNIKPDNLDVFECGCDDFNGFIIAISRISTNDEDTIIVSEATPNFRSKDIDTLISSYGKCCSRLREESNRLGKNTKIILIGGGASHELSFEDAIWYDNIMDIQKTGITDAYLIKDHKSNHYPLRDKIVGFSLGTDFDGMCFFKEKENEDIQGTSD